MLFTCLSFLSYSLSFDKPAFCLLHTKADYDKQCKKKKTPCRCPLQFSIGGQVVSHDATMNPYGAVPWSNVDHRYFGRA